MHNESELFLPGLSCGIKANFSIISETTLNMLLPFCAMLFMQNGILSINDHKVKILMNSGKCLARSTHQAEFNSFLKKRFIYFYFTSVCLHIWRDGYFYLHWALPPWKLQHCPFWSRYYSSYKLALPGHKHLQNHYTWTERMPCPPQYCIPHCTASDQETHFSAREIWEVPQS